MTVAGVSDRPPARSAAIGRPAASKNATAPVVRSTSTRSFAVAIVALRSVFVSFQAGGVHFLGAAISDGRVKNASSLANATRTMSSAQTSIRRRPPATENVGKRESAESAAPTGGRRTGLAHPTASAAATTSPRNDARRITAP